MTHILTRGDTAANWAYQNPILMERELGVETDTLKAKWGDGVSNWDELPYAISPPPDLSLYAPIASPTFTGDPKAPTPATSDNDTSIATTAFVKAQLTDTALAGNPTAPTPATADNDTSIATTAFVKAQAYAPLASPVLTGNPTAPTPAAADNDTSIATTAFVKTAAALKVLGRYANTFSMIPFSGFPANGTRYNPATWASIAVPAGSHYATILVTADCRASAGVAQITYFLAASVGAGAYSDLTSQTHNNNADVYQSLNATLLSDIDVTGQTLLNVQLHGTATSGLNVVNTFFTSIQVTFIGH